MGWARNIVLVTIALAVLGYVGILFGVNMPATASQSESTATVNLAINTAFTILHIGAALLFLLTLRIYKARLRPAYVFISLGIVIVALGTLQIPLLTAFGRADSPWITQGGVGLPFLLSGIFAYVGGRQLAKLVKLKSYLTSFWVVLPAIAGISVLAVALPHAESTLPATAIAISSAVDTWIGGFFLVAALLVWKVMRTAGLHYRNSTLSLGAGFFTSALIMLALVAEMHLGIAIEANYTILVLALIAGIAYLYAGYAFAKTEEY